MNVVLAGVIACVALLLGVLAVRRRARFVHRLSPHEHLLREHELVEIGRGARRVCYRIGDTGFCVKFLREPSDGQSGRKVGWRFRQMLKNGRFNRRQNVNCLEADAMNRYRREAGPLVAAAFPETVEVVFDERRGYGVLMSYLTNADGSRIIRAEYEMAKRRDPAFVADCCQHLAALFEELIASAAPFFEPANVQVQFKADGTFRLRLIDFEPVDKKLVPITEWLLFARRINLRRKTELYMKNLRKKHGLPCDASRAAMIDANGICRTTEEHKEAWRMKTCSDDNKDLSVAILGWKSPVTTRHSLATYREAGLYDCCGEFFIYYNQYSDEDRALGEEMGVRTCGGPENLGNWGGQKKILETAKGDYILFLENDHPVVTTPEETRHWITEALNLLKSGKADMVQLRHRQRLGGGYGFGRKPFAYYYVHDLNPAYADYVKMAADIPSDYNRDTFMRKLRRFLFPSKALRRSISALYLEKNPEKVLPKHIRREGDFFIVDSAILNFSESPFMVSRAFYEKLSAWAEKHPRHRTILGFQNLEYILNCHWWRQQHFRIAVCERGVFGHQRKDDSWRPNHASFSRELVENGKRGD